MPVDKLDRYRGCLLGGAAGDALGYPVEFLSLAEIRKQYGPAGITEYKLQRGVAQISDDTQMALFTANGLLYNATRRRLFAPGGGPETYVMAGFYQEWLRTQQEPYRRSAGWHFAWLMNVPDLYRRRAPGCTCMEAIAREAQGTPEDPINESKGCGGIMRVAPAGLWLDYPENVCQLATELAAMTHGHELGYLPAGVLGYCVSALAHGKADCVLDAVRRALKWTARQFPGARHFQELTDLVEKAVRLSGEDREDTDVIRELGEGWVAEETLAIAVYCALKYENDFDRALIAAVNHDGDSDSTGAVTGNLLGARLGLAGIPPKYLERLELKSVILELADDLCQGIPADYGKQYPPPIHLVGAPEPELMPETPEMALWDAKYGTVTYVPKNTD